MKQFSIGSQDFEMLISNDAFYLDKTKQIYNLVSSKSRYYFFSRPRRFGKSLLLSVMKNIFMGKKELFKGLYIYDKWKFEQYPIMYIDFAEYVIGKNLEEFIKDRGVVYIGDKKIKLGEFEKFNLGDILEDIKRKTGKQTVILIDEYDKPVLAHLGDLKKADQVRKFFSELYSPIKSNDANIRLFFISGLTKLMKMSVFSVINNLKDISLRGKYLDLIGYTQEDVESNFKEELKQVAQKNDMSYDDFMQKVKRDYNGFNFGGLPDTKLLYNPRDINSLLDNEQFGYYWAESGIPSGISDFIKDKPVDIQNLMDKERNNELGVTETGLRVHNLNNLKAEILFFHAGYFTIKEIEKEKILKLTYPNKETERVMIEYFLELTFVKNYDIVMWQNVADDITTGILNIKKNNIQEGVHKLIYEIAGTTPGSWLANNPEGWLKTLVGVAIRMNSIYRWGETEGIIGRTDMHIPKGDTIYVIEVKVDRSTKECIKQIEEKYEKQYKLLYKKVVKIGVNWDRKKEKVDVAKA